MPLPRAKKHFGQHFLTDLRVVERTLGYARLTGTETVLEIGPGAGVLTRALAARAAKVVAMEVDPDMVRALEGALPANVEVLHADAVEAPFPPFDVCVSNLPYNVSTPLAFKLLDAGKPAVLMFQKEFADRMAAKAGEDDYSRLSVETAWRADVTFCERVPPTAFVPPPKVTSAIVRLDPRPPRFAVKDATLFHAVVEAAFSERRKKVANALSSARGLLPPRYRASDFSAVPHAGDRAEVVPPEGFGAIADALVDGAGRGADGRRP